jgi:hypothetical protein
MLFEAVVWRTHLGREPERLIDRESREMDIVLWAINDVSAKFLGNNIWGQRVIMYLALHEMIFCTLIGKYF